MCRECDADHTCFCLFLIFNKHFKKHFFFSFVSEGKMSIKKKNCSVSVKSTEVIIPLPLPFYPSSVSFQMPAEKCFSKDCWPHCKLQPQPISDMGPVPLMQESSFSR